MRKTTLTVALVCILGTSLLLPSCIGSFSLTNKLLAWNKTIGNKFVNELVFLAFCVLPVYEVSALADVIVLNSIEFWSGANPVADNQSRVVKGSTGDYLVTNDANGYTIKSMDDGSTVRLDFNSDDRSWAVIMPDGSKQTIFSYVDDSHIALPTPGDVAPIVVETSEAGLWAYQQVANPAMFAMR